jgi:hypothetical protein
MSKYFRFYFDLKALWVDWLKWICPLVIDWPVIGLWVLKTAYPYDYRAVLWFAANVEPDVLRLWMAGFREFGARIKMRPVDHPAPEQRSDYESWRKSAKAKFEARKDPQAQFDKAIVKDWLG